MAALGVRGARHMLLDASASEPGDAAQGASLRHVLNFSGAPGPGLHHRTRKPAWATGHASLC